MKPFAMIAAVTLLLCAPLPGAAIEVVSNVGGLARQPELAAVPVHTVVPQTMLPHLPEPEVVAMMLVGLVLIGYRARRDSDEKFTDSR